MLNYPALSFQGALQVSRQITHEDLGGSYGQKILTHLGPTFCGRVLPELRQGWQRCYPQTYGDTGGRGGERWCRGQKSWPRFL